MSDFIKYRRADKLLCELARVGYLGYCAEDTPHGLVNIGECAGGDRCLYVSGRPVGEYAPSERLEIAEAIFGEIGAVFCEG